MRKPSLHITERDLIVVLSKIKTLNDSFEFDSRKLALQILQRSKPFSIINRKIEVNNQQIEKKVNKVTSSGLEHVFLFSRMLTFHRQKLYHKGITKIDETHKDWPMLKGIVADAVEFHKLFYKNQIDYTHAFSKYIEIGFSKMQKYSLNKFVNLKEAICNAYEYQLEINQDEHSAATEAAHRMYCNAVMTKTGMFTDYKKMPEKYVYFCRAVQEALSCKARIEDYINAQFYGFEWRGGLPDPVQLTGDKAKERYVKYAYEQGIKQKNENAKAIDWRKIKKSR